MNIQATPSVRHDRPQASLADSSPKADGPDLVVDRFDPSTGFPYPGDRIDFSVIVRNGGNQWTDLDLARLASDPELETALNMFASASQNHVLNVLLQREKAQAGTPPAASAHHPPAPAAPTAAPAAGEHQGHHHGGQP